MANGWRRTIFYNRILCKWFAGGGKVKAENFSIHNDDDHRGRFEHFLDYFKNEKQNFIKFIYSNLINGQDVYSC